MFDRYYSILRIERLLQPHFLTWWPNSSVFVLSEHHLFLQKPFVLSLWTGFSPAWSRDFFLVQHPFSPLWGKCVFTVGRDAAVPAVSSSWQAWCFLCCSWTSKPVYSLIRGQMRAAQSNGCCQTNPFQAGSARETELQSFLIRNEKSKLLQHHLLKHLGGCMYLNLHVPYFPPETLHLRITCTSPNCHHRLDGRSLQEWPEQDECGLWQADCLINSTVIRKSDD